MLLMALPPPPSRMSSRYWRRMSTGASREMRFGVPYTKRSATMSPYTTTSFPFIASVTCSKRARANIGRRILGKRRRPQFALLVAGEQAVDVEHEENLFALRRDGHQKLAADAAYGRRRRQQRIALQRRDAAHFVDFEADHAGGG